MHVILVDGNALAWTMFHASEEDYWAGWMSTHAIKAVVNWFRSSLIRNPEAAHVVVWDGRAQWRYDLYPKYKSNRQDTELKRKDRESFNAQLPWIKKLLAHFPLLQIEHPGAEADDVAWGLSMSLARAGHYVEARTDDVDWQQMICERVAWQSLRKGARRVCLDDFKTLAPLVAVCDVKAIAGDSSDCLDGVAQIADKRAATLLQRYGSLERLLNAAADPFSFKEEPKWALPLVLPETQEVVRRNKRMVTLSLGPSLRADDCVTSGSSFDEIELLGMFEELELLFWFDDFEQLFRRYERPMAPSAKQSVLRCLQNWNGAWSQIAATE